MDTVSSWASGLRASVCRVFQGADDLVDTVIAALLCRGHVLIEDVPGVGKTVLARALSLSIAGEYRQIQCTPDLLPADVLGVSIFNPKTRAFEFHPGPVVTNILLVDEINRATPRTQSALLEAMAEAQVSVEGRSMTLPDPFFLVATESPVESEGTFPLPEVQKDRFFLCVDIGYPNRERERAIMRRPGKPDQDTLRPVTDVAQLVRMQRKVVEIHVESILAQYILSIVRHTRTDPRLVLGVSPRGSLALYRGAQAMAAIRGRSYVVPEDVKDMALPVLRKRIILRADRASRGLTETQVIQEVLDKVPVPGLS